MSKASTIAKPIPSNLFADEEAIETADEELWACYGRMPSNLFADEEAIETGCAVSPC